MLHFCVSQVLSYEDPSMRSVSFSLAACHSASWGLADLIMTMQVPAEQTLLPWPMEAPPGTRRKRVMQTLGGVQGHSLIMALQV